MAHWRRTETMSAPLSWSTSASSSLPSSSSPPPGGEVRRGGIDVRIPLSLPLPLAGERSLRESDYIWSAFHRLQHFLAQRGGRISDSDARRPHGLDLELGGVVTTRDHRSRMAHAATRRRRAAGDEADDWLLGFRCLDEFRG